MGWTWNRPLSPARPTARGFSRLSHLATRIAAGALAPNTDRIAWMTAARDAVTEGDADPSTRRTFEAPAAGDPSVTAPQAEGVSSRTAASTARRLTGRSRYFARRLPRGLDTPLQRYDRANGSAKPTAPGTFARPPFCYTDPMRKFASFSATSSIEMCP